jgi:molecular chaperone GrpE (heat shock protein)
MSDEIKLEDDIVSQDDDGQNNSQISDDNNLEEQIKKLKEENHKIQLELNKFKQIAMSAQSQYVSLKYEFESLISRFDNEKKTLETKSFLDNIKKIIPFIEELRKTVELLPHDLSEHNWVK